MPFGFGLHPFFPRTAGTQLQARAATMWTSGADKLPLHEAPPPGAFNFGRGAGMPAEPLDNLFCGWDGKAGITWPGSALSLTIEADMNYYIVYAPPGADFFCFEPLDHAINAHKLAGGAAANGLSVLAPGQSLRHRVSFLAGAA
jgi:aldose 1-epimerase